MRAWILFFASFAIVSSKSQTTFIVDDENAPNEPTIAIHPGSSKLYGASNINNFYTIERQKDRWDVVKFKATSRLGIYGDPVLHYLDTILFFAHLSKTEGKIYGEWFDRIVVQKINSVSTWDETSYSVGFNNGKMQDKPWMSSDDHSIYAGTIYLTWTEFDKYNSPDPNDKSRIRFSSLTIGEDTFSEAITISDSTGNCEDSDNTLEGATSAIGPDGEIFTVWAGHQKIWFDYSIDGGKNWNRDQIIASQPAGWDMTMPHIQRANGMPFICCDRDRDIIYVCWADKKNGNADIWIKYSRDRGRSWSDRIKVNSEIQPSNQYFPNMDINSETGKVYIAYYDQQYSSLQRFYDISCSVLDLSKNNDITTKRVSNQSIPLPGPKVFYGDYLDIDVHQNSIALIYTTNYKGKMAIQVTASPIKGFDDLSPVVYPFSLAPDSYTLKDSTTVYINHQCEGLLTVKCISGSFPQRKKTLIKKIITSNEVNRDNLLITIPNESSYKLKTKFRGLGTNKKNYKAVLKRA